MREPFDVPQAAIRTFWPKARPFIEQALEVGDTPYIAEDIYQALITGIATLHLTMNDSHEVTGCFVINKRRLWWGQDELYVWLLAHANPDHTVVEYLDWLNALTKRANCRRWSADSPRPFHKIVPGLKLESHHFVMEV